MNSKNFIYNILVFGLIFILINHIISVCLKQIERDLINNDLFYPEIRWKDYYRQDSLDLLIIGSSHAYRSYIPSILEKELELNVFNLGSSAQSPVTSYFILEEVLTKHKLKYLILDYYFLTFEATDQLKNGRWNWRYFKNRKNWMKSIIFGTSLKEKIILVFSPASLYRDRIKLLLRKALGLNYLPKDKGIYFDNGYVRNDHKVDSQTLVDNNVFNDYFLDSYPLKNLNYFEKTIELAKKNNIKIFICSPPLPKLSYKKITSIEGAHKKVLEIIDKHNVNFIDYNLNQNRIPSLIDTVHFFDNNHLNYEGAKVFTKEYSSYLSEKLFK